MSAHEFPHLQIYTFSLLGVIGFAFLHEQTLPDNPLKQKVEAINALGKEDKHTNLLRTNLRFQTCIKFDHYSSFYILQKHIPWILKLKKNYIQNIRDVEHQNILFKHLNHRILNQPNTKFTGTQNPQHPLLCQNPQNHFLSVRIFCCGNQLSKGKFPFQKK